MKPGRMGQQNMKGREENQGNIKNEDSKPEDKGKDYRGKQNNFNKDNRKDNRDNRDNRDHHRDNRGGGGGGRNRFHNRDSEGRSHNRDDADQSGDGKFTGRCRLFVGNLPNDTTEDDFKKMFEPYGQASEFYINTQRGFGFVRLDTRQNAEAAKAALDGLQKKGRVLRVRFATHGAALRVKHLGPFVSNEMLQEAFVQFGTLERAVVIVDDRGKPTGEGIVEFARKPGANAAINRINDGVFLIGTSTRPIIVEPLEQRDEEDGLPEKFIERNPQYQKEKETGIRFAKPGSFDYDFAQKWKELYRMEEDKKEQLKRHMEEQFTKLELDMGQAHIEHQAMLLRQDYLRKQEELKRMEEMHQQEVQRRLDMRRQEEDIQQRRQEDQRRQEMMMRQQQEEEMRRRQMEGGRPMDGGRSMEGGRGGRGGPGGPGDMGGFGGHGGPGPRDMRGERDRNAPPMPPPPAPPAGLGIDRPNRGGGGMGNQGMGGMPGNMGGNQGGNMGGNMGGGGGGNNNQQMQRQSRFDQPPGGNMGGGFGGNNMGGGPGGNMGGGPGGNMGGGPGGNMGGMGNQGMGGPQGGGRGPMGNDRMMDRRERRGGDDYFENKRPRRY